MRGVRWFGSCLCFSVRSGLQWIFSHRPEKQLRGIRLRSLPGFKSHFSQIAKWHFNLLSLCDFKEVYFLICNVWGKCSYCCLNNIITCLPLVRTTNYSVVPLVWPGFFNCSKVSLKLFHVSAHHVLTWEVDSCTAIAVGRVRSGAWGLYALTPAAKMCGAFLLQHIGQVNKPKAHILFALIMTLLSKCIKLGYQHCRVHCNERQSGKKKKKIESHFCVTNDFVT